MNLRRFSLLAMAIIHLAAAGATPQYTAQTILPSGQDKLSPLTPGMLVSIYGTNLGPQAPCTASPDPQRHETPNPSRPNQTLVETQVFPKNLCDTEVHVGGVAAGILYVRTNQINFKVPQATPTHGTTEVRVSYKNQSGPAVTVDLAEVQKTEPAAALVEEIWTELHHIPWDTPYRQPARGSSTSCKLVPPTTTLRGGLYDYAYYCAKTTASLITETYYYPTNPDHPVILLKRADFRLATAYPEMSAEVEKALRQRLTHANGSPAIPDALFEIGVAKLNPGLRWRSGATTLFLHRNRLYAAPVGIREGVQLIAVRQELLNQKETERHLQQTLGSATALAPAKIATDLHTDLGELYLMPGQRPKTEPERANAERQTRLALTRLLRLSKDGDPGKRAAILVASDELTVRLGRLLVLHSTVAGSEKLTESANTPAIRRELGHYGITYTGPGHDSGDLEYNRVLLRRASEEFPETPWGQRAFLMTQSLLCGAPFAAGCQGPNCFLKVISQGEKFLVDHPNSPFRVEQLYHLATAFETQWSLSRAQPGDPSAEGGGPSSARTVRHQDVSVANISMSAPILPWTTM